MSTAPELATQIRNAAEIFNELPDKDIVRTSEPREIFHDLCKATESLYAPLMRLAKGTDLPEEVVSNLRAALADTIAALSSAESCY